MAVVGQNRPVVPSTFTQSAAPGSAGAASSSDDAARIQNQQAAVAGGAFDSSITPLPNLLGQYSSYTYALTWYLMTPEAMGRLQNGDYSVLNSQIIIAQSGGVANDQRNPYFDVDFYFEDMEFKTQLAGASNKAPSSLYEISFTIVEPNGITLMPRLTAAINGGMGTTGGSKQAWGSQNYLMAIRFYGYDENGNLAQVGLPLQGGQSALVTKYLPFIITDFEFKVENKLVEYKFKGTVSGTYVATAQNQNSLMYNVELSGQSVKEILTTGTTVTTGNQPGANANTNNGQTPDGATPKNTVRLGLTAALNQWQQDLVKQGAVEYPHTYVIEFVDDEIANAKVTVKDGTTKGTGMPVRGTAADKLDPNRQAMDPTVRLMDFTAGQQITQIIDQTIRNSTYITNQSNLTVAETTQNVAPKANQGLTWFNISFQATPKQYDAKRNDYAYTIRYIISKYRVVNMISPYFVPSAFPGVHKTYEYWFTGKNTEVLSYEQVYTPKTVITIGNKSNTGSTATNDEYLQNPAPRSGESAQGAKGRTNDIAANAAEFLYGLDLTYADITILGDPAWIPQNEVVGVPATSEWSSKAFMADGTINFNSGQTLFEIAINAPADYDLSTGLMDPDTQISGILDNVGKENQARRRYVYMALDMTSHFNKGTFTQSIKGQWIKDKIDARFDQINAMIGTETRQGVFDKTPLRTSRFVNNATDYGLVTGGAIPTAQPHNPNPQPPNVTGIRQNLLPNLPASPATSNGDIRFIGGSAPTLVTNSTTQTMNRET